MPKQLGGWPQAPPLLEMSPGWTSLLLEAAGHGRQVRGKTKDKDRDVTPTIGGLIDPVSDDDTVDKSKGAAKSATKARGKGGWTPQVDVSYRGCPYQLLPPGARPRENIRRGDITIRHEDVANQRGATLR